MATDLARRLSLIVITDAALAAPRGIVEVVRMALQGGAPAIQLRDKHAPARDLAEMARLLLRETRAAGALLFVNDRLDVALAAGADGAHLGDDDLPLHAARASVPAGFLLGRSVDNPSEARDAVRLGADYVGVGPVFQTSTKGDAGTPIGLEVVRTVVEAVPIPVVGIGGIDAGNAPAVRTAGAAGVAVIRAVMQAKDPTNAVKLLLRSPPASVR